MFIEIRCCCWCSDYGCLHAWKVGDRGFKPHSGLKVSKKLNVSSPLIRKFHIVGSPRDRKVAYSASDHQGSNFEFCIWRPVSFHSLHHPQEVLLAQFSLYVHKGSLNPIDFLSFRRVDLTSGTTITRHFQISPYLLPPTWRDETYLRHSWSLRKMYIESDPPPPSPCSFFKPKTSW